VDRTLSVSSALAGESQSGSHGCTRCNSETSTLTNLPPPPTPSPTPSPSPPVTIRAMVYKDTYVQANSTVFPKLPFDPSTSVLALAEIAAASAGTPLHIPPIIAMLNGPADLLVRWRAVCCVLWPGLACAVLCAKCAVLMMRHLSTNLNHHQQTNTHRSGHRSHVPPQVSSSLFTFFITALSCGCEPVQLQSATTSPYERLNPPSHPPIHLTAPTATPPVLVVPPQGADLAPAHELGWPPLDGLQVSPGAVSSGWITGVAPWCLFAAGAHSNPVFLNLAPTDVQP